MFYVMSTSNGNYRYRALGGIYIIHFKIDIYCVKYLICSPISESQSEEDPNTPAKVGTKNREIQTLFSQRHKFTNLSRIHNKFRLVPVTHSDVKNLQGQLELMFDE